MKSRSGGLYHYDANNCQLFTLLLLKRIAAHSGAIGRLMTELNFADGIIASYLFAASLSKARLSTIAYIVKAMYTNSKKDPNSRPHYPELPLSDGRHYWVRGLNAMEELDASSEHASSAFKRFFSTARDDAYIRHYTEKLFGTEEGATPFQSTLKGLATSIGKQEEVKSALRRLRTKLESSEA
jgi:hypothetical protein